MGWRHTGSKPQGGETGKAARDFPHRETAGANGGSYFGQRLTKSSWAGLGTAGLGELTVPV